MKDLANASKSEQKSFFASFDQVLCDVDGVVWFMAHEIPGSSEGIKNLISHGKTLRFVSNNATRPFATYQNQIIDKFQLDLDCGDILITPTVAVIDYLRTKDIRKEIFLIGTDAIRKDLENAGFKIAERYQKTSSEVISLPNVVDNLNPNEDIGAVVIDYDFDVNFIDLQRAVEYLKNPDVLFIINGPDKYVCISSDKNLIGPHYFQQAVAETARREPVVLAKPSKDFGDFIAKKYQIKDRSRVLFVGDSISEDLGFAHKNGYQKLLVLSGISSKSDLNCWRWPEEYKPTYYVSNLKVLGEILQVCDS